MNLQPEISPDSIVTKLFGVYFPSESTTEISQSVNYTLYPSMYNSQTAFYTGSIILNSQLWNFKFDSLAN